MAVTDQPISNARVLQLLAVIPALFITAGLASVLYNNNLPAEPAALSQAAILESLTIANRSRSVLVDPAAIDEIRELAVATIVAERRAQLWCSLAALAVSTLLSMFVIRYTGRIFRQQNIALKRVAATIRVRILQYAKELATATQDTSKSVDEIARCSSRAGQALGIAVGRAENSAEKVAGLGEQANSVSRLIGEITSIAEQTNLLALNATIEAARAGVAGKGFAVVAAEVKQLADVTHKTAEGVVQRVRDIQQSSLETSQSTGRVVELMRESHESQVTIVSAVEELRSIISQQARQAETLVEEVQYISSSGGDADPTGSGARQTRPASMVPQRPLLSPAGAAAI